MNIIVCVDNAGGIGFNYRRQSTDSVVRERILGLTKGSRLWMSHYSVSQFDISTAPQINKDDAFFSKVAPGEFCFLECQTVGDYTPWAESLFIFRWNRDYPADTFFDIDYTKPEWRLRSREEFKGSSHNKNTLEVYER